jgi:hypothetical protein
VWLESELQEEAMMMGVISAPSELVSRVLAEVLEDELLPFLPLSADAGALEREMGFLNSLLGVKEERKRVSKSSPVVFSAE